MNKILFLILLSPLFLLAQRTVILKPNAELLYPSADDFKSANDISSVPKYFRVLVDTSPTVAYRSDEKIDFFACDAELKFVDSNGNFKYWFSTVGAGFEDTYSTHLKRDVGGRAFFQCPDIWGCTPKRWIEFQPSIFNSIYEQALVLARTSTPEISNILIEPNVEGNLLDGSSVAEIFNIENANLMPTITRLDAAGFEQTAGGKTRWRIANVTTSPVKLKSEDCVIIPKNGDDIVVNYYASATVQKNDDASFQVLRANDGASVTTSKSFNLKAGDYVYVEYTYVSGTGYVHLQIRDYIIGQTQNSSFVCAAVSKTYPGTSVRNTDCTGKDSVGVSRQIFKITRAAQNARVHFSLYPTANAKVSTIKVYKWSSDEN